MTEAQDSLSRIAGRARADEVSTALKRAADLLTTVSSFYDRKADSFSVNDPFLIQAVDAAGDFVGKVQNILAVIELSEAPVKPEPEPAIPESSLMRAITSILDDPEFESDPANKDDGGRQVQQDTVSTGRDELETVPPKSKPSDRPASEASARPAPKLLRPAFARPVAASAKVIEPEKIDATPAAVNIKPVDLHAALPEPKVPPVPEGPALTYLELLRKLTAAEIFAAEQQALAPPGTQHVLLPLLRDLREDIQRLHSVA